MKIYEKILKLAVEGKLPKNISKDSFPDIDIFVELYQRGLIDAIDASSYDGKAFLEPKITFEGRKYYDSLKRKSNKPMATKETETKKVFISYVKENADEVGRISAKFSEEGIDYWIDREDIEPGKLWKTAIRDAINSGAYFLACFSTEHNKREETYMNEELLEAIGILRIKHYDSGWFIPIKLSACEIPNYEIGAGKTLRDIHHLKFYEDWNTAMERLIDIIKREEELKQPDIYDKFFEKQYIYQGLKCLIERGDGTGFHNSDLGHPVYVMGATGELHEAWEYADSPKRNRLFKMLSSLSKELKGLGIEEYRFIWWYDFSEWKDFCKFAVDVYNKKRGY